MATEQCPTCGGSGHVRTDAPKAGNRLNRWCGLSSQTPTIPHGPVTAKNWCYGCKTYICDNCLETLPFDQQPVGAHVPHDHVTIPDEEEE